MAVIEDGILKNMKQQFCPYCGTAATRTNYCANCGGQLQQDAPLAGRAATSQVSFNYPVTERHSDIISDDAANGESVVTFRHLHPNAVWLFFFQYFGKTSILLVLFAMTAMLEPLFSAALIIGYFVSLFVAAELNYNNYKFEVSARAFRKEYGVFHKYSVNIAFDQIQNINMRRSVLDQMLGLAHLELETAGTGGDVKKNIGGLFTSSEGYIPGISPEEARDVKALMLARINEK